jgi:hypothetical protein
MRRFHIFLMLVAVLTVAFGAAATPKHAAAAPPREEVGENEAAPQAEAAKPEAAKATAESDDTETIRHEPMTVKVGINVKELNKLDLAQETYTAEFMVSYRCDKAPCNPDPEIINGKISGKIEKLHDEPLYKIFKIKADLTAVIDLKEYPFDNHQLPIVLSDKTSPEDITFIKDDEECGLSALKLPGWTVAGWDAGAIQEDVGDGRKLSQFVFNIEARRPAMMATFKSIVPVLIMLFVAAFTLLLKPKSAAGRLSAATGGLMSVVMFQVGQVGSLPPTGYLTLLDKFMIATYLVYLLNILCTVAMVRFEEKKNERMSELAYLVAAGAVPGLALVVWLSVFFRLV